MAAINDLIARIQDPELRMRIEKEEGSQGSWGRFF